MFPTVISQHKKSWQNEMVHQNPRWNEDNNVKCSFFRALQLTEQLTEQPLQPRVMTSCKSPPQPNHPYLLPPWKNWTHARHAMSKPLWHNPYHHKNNSNQILDQRKSHVQTGNYPSAPIAIGIFIEADKQWTSYNGNNYKLNHKNNNYGLSPIVPTPSITTIKNLA